MSSTHPGGGGDASNAAHFYYPQLMLDPRYGQQDAPDIDCSCFLPAVGFVSTPMDLARFGAAMVTGTLLDPGTVEDIQTPVSLASGDASDRAMGWTARRRPIGPDGAEVRVIGQGLDEPVVRRPLSATSAGGQIAGSTSTLLTVPDRGLTVAVASNVSGASGVPELAERLAAIFISTEP